MNIQKINELTLRDIQNSFENFNKTIEEREKNDEDFIFIDEIEDTMEKLIATNKKIALEHVGNMITSINEKKLIELKKKSSKMPV